jgi:hypothetical protein
VAIETKYVEYNEKYGSSYERKLEYPQETHVSKWASTIPSQIQPLPISKETQP